MKAIWPIPVITFFLLATASIASAQKVQFSADMEISQNNNPSQTLKMFVGNQRARFDRAGADNDSDGIDSLLIDFDHQFIFLVMSQPKLYFQVEGSLGMPFYSGSWLFRPASANTPCHEWVTEAGRRGVTLRCNAAGEETVDGRTTKRWDATSEGGGHGSIWYDPTLNFIVKVVRFSKTGVESGYELHNAKPASQPPALFEVPKDYRKFTMTKLIDVFTGFGE